MLKLSCNLVRDVIKKNDIGLICRKMSAYNTSQGKNKRNILRTYSRFKDEIIRIIVRDEDKGLEPIKNREYIIFDESDFIKFATLYAIKIALSEISTTVGGTRFITYDGIFWGYDLENSCKIKYKPCSKCGYEDLFVYKNGRLFGINSRHDNLSTCYPKLEKIRILNQL